MIKFHLQFPTILHEQAADRAYVFFQPKPGVDTVLVVNSCARGQGIPESDLDMAVLIDPGMPDDEAARLEAEWQRELVGNEVLRRFRLSGEHSHIHLDVVRGKYHPETWDDGGGPDGFELGIGNLIAYGAPLHSAGSYYRYLQTQWLPYYIDDLRNQRLSMACSACRYDLEHVPFFIRRELYFQAFDRLYKGIQEFLQALFISRRVYPLAYNKWIRMQVVEWLGLPQLYAGLPPLLSVSNLQSGELVAKANDLKMLLENWVSDS